MIKLTSFQPISSPYHHNNAMFPNTLCILDYTSYYCQKTSQFKTVCKDDSGYITQLKQQKSKR